MYRPTGKINDSKNSTNPLKSSNHQVFVRLRPGRHRMDRGRDPHCKPHGDHVFFNTLCIFFGLSPGLAADVQTLCDASGESSAQGELSFSFLLIGFSPNHLRPRTLRFTRETDREIAYMPYSSASFEARSSRAY
jgi:hypothetical protein